MSLRNALLEKARIEQIIGVVREDDAAVAEAVADAYARNGVRIIEITLTTPAALDLIAKLVARYAEADVVIAAGTVRSSNDAAAARRAGAQVIVSPPTDYHVIEYANENDLLSIAGASTPTEIIRAWEAGTDIDKVYPAAHTTHPRREPRPRPRHALPHPPPRRPRLHPHVSRPDSRRANAVGPAEV